MEVMGDCSDAVARKRSLNVFIALAVDVPAREKYYSLSQRFGRGWLGFPLRSHASQRGAITSSRSGWIPGLPNGLDSIVWLIFNALHAS